MTKSFREKWLEAVEKKDSVLCAGLDPAETAMGRGKKGLFHLTPKHVYSRGYFEAVAPYCAALKPNLQYWKDEGDVKALREMIQRAHALDLLVIDDSKLADIGSTNDAGFYHAAKSGFDAVTVAPYAGNMAEAAKQAHERGVGAIAMCIMSNPEYEREKNSLTPILYDDTLDFTSYDVMSVGVHKFVKRYMFLAQQAKKHGLDGIVIGAPSEGNHIADSEIERVRHYVGGDMLVLMPGVGAQGGEAEAIWRHFHPDNVIVNVGRALMFPDGNNDPRPGAIAAKAEFYRDMLNRKRKSA